MNQTPIAHNGRNAHTFPSQDRRRPPGALRQLAEIAPRLNITPNQLRAAVATAIKTGASEPPRPWSTYRRNATRVTYYVERDVIAWYKASHQKTEA